MNPYQSDLASIHDEGFGQLAESAARLLVAELERRCLPKETVVDLGCASGVTARWLTDEGYSVIGLDLSASLIELTRRRVPEATFRVDSFVGAEIPAAVAVCAVGEVLNYTFDVDNKPAERNRLFSSIFTSLAPGGLFLLDVAGPDRAPSEPIRTFFESDDWVVLVETSGTAEVLNREITTFRRYGDLYRRASETHRLHLVAPETIETELETSGFQVERTEDYDDTHLPSGVHGFLATKPANGRVTSQ